MKLNLNAVFNAINQLFSEAVEVTDKKLIEKFIESEAGIKPPFYHYQPIDTKNADALRALADKKLSEYLKQHTDNSMQLFLTNEVKTAKLYQSYLPKFETDSQQKTYYFRLERWIEVLEYIQKFKAEPLDQRFSISSDFWEQEKTKVNYKGLQSEIAKRGFFNRTEGIETIKIYTAQLAVYFSSVELPVKNLDTQTETKIKSEEYIRTYIEGYKRGEQYFETNYKVSPEFMFGAGAKNYVNDIHMKYFHLKHGGNEGWVYVKNVETFILTHKIIEEYGYYSGLVNKVEQLIIEHPRPFAAFEKCEHNIQPQQVAPIKINESRAKEFIADIISSMDNKGWEYAFVSEHDYNLFTDLLTSYFEFKPYKLPDATIQLKRACKTKLARALGDIHGELCHVKKLSADIDFFEIIRTLNHFEKETHSELNRTLRR